MRDLEKIKIICETFNDDASLCCGSKDCIFSKVEEHSMGIFICGIAINFPAKIEMIKTILDDMMWPIEEEEILSVVVHGSKTWVHSNPGFPQWEQQ